MKHSPPPSTARSSERYRAIDALRGYAALSVLVFHLLFNSAWWDLLAGGMPEWAHLAVGSLRNGVAVFFVISGFVIGYTTQRLATPGDGGLFALRRQIRLDPPYYVMIAVALALAFAEARLGFDTREFTFAEVALNLLYLQNISGVPEILPVAWTLCLEVQFYLVVVAVTLLASALARSNALRRRSIARGAMLALGAFSISMPLLGLTAGPWFIGLWWQFCLGATLSWFVRGEIGNRFMLAVLGAAAGILLLTAAFAPARADAWWGEWFALAAAIAIHVFIVTGTLTRGHGRVPLHLGRLSYSLYLVHFPVAGMTMGAILKITGPSIPAAVFAVVAGAVTSLIAAELLMRFVEGPAIRWAVRLKDRARMTPARAPRAARPQTAPTGA
ncbi:acyltransferase family protein [Microbacterium rhizophilus]|uniref:acyltransferase family protein n=1 Tax=Microbacterium rhizophilus TaxID=3138934 RepID=UPI0031F02969